MFKLFFKYELDKTWTLQDTYKDLSFLMSDALDLLCIGYVIKIEEIEVENA
jgi:hypothetical protein